MKQIGSEIITSPEGQLSSVGMPGGERGLAISESLAAAEWLAKQPVASVDKALRSRASSLGVVLQVKYSGQAVSDVTATGDLDACREFQRLLRHFMQPAPAREIEGWLAELSVLVARRAYEEVDDTLRVVAYTARLKGYPADVVRHALLEKTWRFWPTWEELREECIRLSALRRCAEVAIRKPKPIELMFFDEVPKGEFSADLAEMVAELNQKAGPKR